MSDKQVPEANQKRVVSREKQVSQQMFSADELKALIDYEVNEVLPEFRKDVRFEVQKYSEMYDTSEYVALFVLYKDYETEAEMQERFGQEQVMKDAQEQRDRAEYERLSKKFAQN